MARYTLDGKVTREETENLGRQLRELNEEARANIDNPQWLSDRAQEMTNAIYEGFQHENLISLLSSVTNASWDQRVTWSEVRGLKAVWLARGGYIEASSVHRETAEIERDLIGFHVFENMDKLEANFGETTSTLVELGIERMDAEINSRFLSLLQAAVGSGHPNYHAGSGVGLSTVNTALAAVRDASRQRQVAIVGRHTMTDQIMYDLMGTNYNGAGFLPATNEEMVTRGVLGTYLGAPIISLVNYLDEDDLSYFPANELFVVAPDASKTAFFGGLRGASWVEDDNDFFHFRTRREAGFVVHNPNRVARIVDTSVAP